MWREEKKKGKMREEKKKNRKERIGLICKRN
jgi:hypothetical protein